MKPPQRSMWIKKKTHIIAVHTHYRGNLIKGKYQFAFGGNTSSELDTGSLVPQSGRIKKIRVKISHEGKDFYDDIFESGSVFTIIMIRDTEEVSNLLTYECFKRDHSLSVNDARGKKCGFENIPISEGDVLNIRTEKNYNENIFRGINISLSFLLHF